METSKPDEIKEFIQKEFMDRIKSIENFNVSGIIKFTVDNEKFSILFTKSNITLWGDDGLSTLLGIRYNYLDGFTDYHFQRLLEEIKNYIAGYIHCTDCHKLIKVKDVAGTYFAGRYCKDCWEREWKEREANENYE